MSNFRIGHYSLGTPDAAFDLPSMSMLGCCQHLSIDPEGYPQTQQSLLNLIHPSRYLNRRVE
jgi:hypothetical protein